MLSHNCVLCVLSATGSKGSASASFRYKTSACERVGERKKERARDRARERKRKRETKEKKKKNQTKWIWGEAVLEAKRKMELEGAGGGMYGGRKRMRTRQSEWSSGPS